jgi:hypothetical protein
MGMGNGFLHKAMRQQRKTAEAATNVPDRLLPSVAKPAAERQATADWIMVNAL